MMTILRLMVTVNAKNWNDILKKNLAFIVRIVYYTFVENFT